jgi:hypothetical protein
MIPQTLTGTVAQSSAEVHPLEADQDAALDALRSRVYSKPDTWIQELLANARDAVRERRKVEPDAEGGVRLRIDHDARRVTVEDDGPGMTRALLVDVFRVMGRSTRRDSDDYTGAWGIGSKSPLKVCDSFRVQTRSRDDRMAYRLVVGRFLTEGVARWGFAIEDAQPCDGPWGTDVMVEPPVEILELCAQRARRTCAYWTDPVQMTSVKDGVAQVETLGGAAFDDGAVLAIENEDFSACWVPPKYASHRGSLLVLVDDIPYRTRDLNGEPELRIRLKRPSLVDLTTGREALDETERTKAVVTAAATLLQVEAEARMAVALKDLEAAPRDGREPHRLRVRSLVQAHHLLRSVYDLLHVGGTRPLPGKEFHPLLARVEMWSVGHYEPRPWRSRFRERAAYNALDGAPIFYAPHIRLPAVSDRLESVPGTQVRGHLLRLPDDASPLRDALVKAGAQYVPPTRDTSFQVRRALPGGRTGTVREPKELSRHVPVVVAERVADLWCLPFERATFLLRPSQRALRVLRRRRLEVMTLGQFLDRLANLTVPTTAGPRALGKLGNRVTWIHGIPASLLPHLRVRRGIVAAGEVDLKLAWERLSPDREKPWERSRIVVHHRASGKPLQAHLDRLYPGLADILRWADDSTPAVQRKVAALVERLLSTATPPAPRDDATPSAGDGEASAGDGV